MEKVGKVINVGNILKSRKYRESREMYEIEEK